MQALVKRRGLLYPGNSFTKISDTRIKKGVILRHSKDERKAIARMFREPQHDTQL
jgi:hypothetical protein